MIPNWLSVLIAWLPFIGLVIAYILCVRFSRPRTASGFTMIDLYEQQIAETQRTNALMERIAVALEKPSAG